MEFGTEVRSTSVQLPPRASNAEESYRDQIYLNMKAMGAYLNKLLKAKYKVHQTVCVKHTQAKDYAGSES